MAIFRCVKIAQLVMTHCRNLSLDHCAYCVNPRLVFYYPPWPLQLSNLSAVSNADMRTGVMRSMPWSIMQLLRTVHIDGFSLYVCGSSFACLMYGVPVTSSASQRSLFYYQFQPHTNGNTQMPSPCCHIKSLLRLCERSRRS